MPILGLRALRYVAEGRPGRAPPIAGLRFVPVGVAGATAEWHGVTGQTGFAELPPGPRRILETDPERRFLPAAVTVIVPSRHPRRPTADDTVAETPQEMVSLRPGRSIRGDILAG